MYGYDVLNGISKGTFEIPHTIYLTNTLKDTIVTQIQILRAVRFKGS